MRQIKILVYFAVSIVIGGLGCMAYAAGGGDVIATDPTKHYHPKGKMPSAFTVDLQRKCASHCLSMTSGISRSRKRGLSQPPITNKLWLMRAMSPGTWAATSGYCRARISTASIPHCSVRPF
jgi:hypothetical protein